MSKKDNQFQFGTKLLHTGSEVDEATGAVVPPIHQSSTFKQDSACQFGPYIYSRRQNPTRKALEETVASLEGGKYGLAFSSGMGAISSSFMIFSPGDHIIAPSDIYGGTYQVLTGLFERWGLEVSFVDTTDLDNIKNAIQNNTKGLYLETPSNPLLRITDLKGAARIATENNLITLADNTFMTPLYLRPLELGVDIVLHSATKFLGGHSDVVAGLAVTDKENLANRLYHVQRSFGAILGPQDSWLTMRGIKTLKARMDFQQTSALEISQWLKKDERIEEVFYPGLEDHAGKDILDKQGYGYGAVLSFKTKDKETAFNLMENVEIPILAVSLGAVESIISYPFTMSHGAMPEEVKNQHGVTENLIRLSVGLEETKDLIRDLNRHLTL